MINLAIAAFFVFLIYVLSPKKKPTITYVFFESKNGIYYKEATTNLRGIEPSTSLYIGMFTGSDEDARHIKDLLERQQAYYRKSDSRGIGVN